MAHQIPTSEPAELRVGDSWQWTRADLTDYPASVWSLSYNFRNAASFFDVNAVADGEAFAVNVPPATTAALTPGAYSWYAFVSDGTDRHQVDAGEADILPDVTAAAAYDGRSLNRRLLDAVNAILESRATLDQIDLVASAGGGMSATRNPEFLHAEKTRLETAVKREETGRGGLLNISARLRR